MVLRDLLNWRKNAKSIPKFFNNFTFSLHGQILGGGMEPASAAAKYSEACGSVKITKDALELLLALSFT
jgi:hypothetical protein